MKYVQIWKSDKKGNHFTPKSKKVVDGVKSSSDSNGVVKHKFLDKTNHVFMARKVSEDIVDSFLAGQKRSISNSNTDGESLFLHGNKIAWRVPDGFFITTAGWNTLTTKERLNALPNVHIRTVKGKLILNGNEWDGSAIKINY